MKILLLYAGYFRITNQSSTNKIFRFQEFDSSLHEGARQELKRGGEGVGAAGDPENRNRKSYMKTGSLTIFSDLTSVK